MRLLLISRAVIQFFGCTRVLSPALTVHFQARLELLRNVNLRALASRLRLRISRLFDKRGSVEQGDGCFTGRGKDNESSTLRRLFNGLLAGTNEHQSLVPDLLTRSLEASEKCSVLHLCSLRTEVQIVVSSLVLMMVREFPFLFLIDNIGNSCCSYCVLLFSLTLLASLVLDR